MCLTHRRVIVVISPFWKTNQANTVLAKKQLPCKNISLGNSLPITIQPSASICTNQWHLQNKWKVSIAALSKCNCPCFPISILVPLDPPDYSPKTPPPPPASNLILMPGTLGMPEQATGYCMLLQATAHICS